MKPTTAALSLLILVIVVGLFLSYLYAISPKTENSLSFGNKAADVKKVESIVPSKTPEQIEEETKAMLLQRLKNLEKINISGTTTPEMPKKILTKEEEAKAKAELLDRLKKLEDVKVATGSEE
jgi:hypothetical protein